MIDKREEVSYIRGQRVIAVRNVLGYSRRKLSKIIDIPFGTLQNWEAARHGGINEEGAQRLSDALTKYLNVIVTKNWLLHGIGQSPVFPNLVIIQGLFNHGTLDSEKDKIQQELALFYKLNPNCLDHKVQDSLMHPIFYKGDQVAGPIITDIKNINLFDKPFIVQTENDEILVRLLALSSNNKEAFDLIAYNNGNHTKTHSAIKIKQLAKVVWMRRES